MTTTPWVIWADLEDTYPHSLVFCRRGHFASHEEAFYGLLDALRLEGVATVLWHARELIDAAEWVSTWMGVPEGEHDQVVCTADGYTLRGEEAHRLESVTLAVLPNPE